MNYEEIAIQQAMEMVNDLKESIRATRNKIFYLLGFYFAVITLLLPSILDNKIGIHTAIFCTSIMMLILTGCKTYKSIKPSYQMLKGIEPTNFSYILDIKRKDEMFKVLLSTYQSKIDDLKNTMKDISIAYNKVFQMLLIWFALLTIEYIIFSTIVV